jgi:hypothetical protein
MEPQELRDEWVRMFKEEYAVRAGYGWDEMSDGETFAHFYGDTAHEAVMRSIAKYDMTDVTAGKTVWYVIQDDDGVYLVHDDPHDDLVLWVGTDQSHAERVLCDNSGGE